MQFQSMLPSENLEIISDLRRAKRCTHENVRFLIRQKKLISLPPNIKDVAHIKRVELDLSYNKTLDHESTFKTLASLGNIYGLGLIKHEKGTLDDNIGLLSTLEHLNLWSNGLKSLPVSFSKLKNLKILNLRNNHLKKIPSYFKDFKQLKYLNLQFNKIKVLPDFIYELIELEELNLSTCDLSELSPKLGNLKKLKKLNIKKNNIETLPDCFEDMIIEEIKLLPNKEINLEQYITVLSKAKHLKKLDLSDLKLEKLPSNIGLLQHLEVLNISNNRIKEIPESFGDLNLISLNIRGNLLDINQALPILGRLKCYTQVYDGEFINFRDNNEVQISSSIGQCQFITSISFHGKADIILPEEVSECIALQSIHFHSTGLKKLPQVITRIPHLKSLYVQSNTQLEMVEDWIYELHNLESIIFQNNGVKLDPIKAKSLKSLSSWHIENFTVEEFNVTLNMPHIKQITFNRNEKNFTMPSAYFENKNLEIVNLYALENLNIDDFLVNLPKLEKVKEISFHPAHSIDINSLAEIISKFPNLEKLTCKSYTNITSHSLEALRSLKEINLIVYINNKYSHNLPLNYIHFPTGILKLNQNSIFVKELDKIIEAIKNEVDSEFHEIAYLLKTRSFDALNENYPSPFLKNNSLKNRKVYIASSPSSGTLTELRNNLIERGAKISKKISHDVTDIFISPKLKEDFDNEIIGDYNYILEDHLKAKEIEEDTPYLMENGNNQLIEQITNLLKSKEENQLPLVIELIAGGGATKKLNSYLMAIHLFAKDIEIRKSSRNLFRKYASSDLQLHIKKIWKESMRNQKHISNIKKLVLHPEIDISAFILAWHITEYYNPDKNNNQYYINSLDIRSLGASAFTDSFKDIDYLNSLSFDSDPTTSINQIFEYIRNNPLEYITAACPMPSTPKQLFYFKGVKNLRLGNYNFESHMDLAELVDINIDIINLSLTKVDILNASFLSKFPNLQELHLSHCKLETLTGVYQLKQLKVLDVHTCQLDDKKITSDLEYLRELERVTFYDCGIEEFDLNFSNFPRLKNISLAKNKLKALPDTFKGCLEVERIDVSENDLSTLPQSIFIMKYNNSSSQLNLNASKNSISHFDNSQSNQSFFTKFFKSRETKELSMDVKRIGTLDLNDNNLGEIPEMLLIQSIHQLQLENNPIYELNNVNYNKIGRINIRSPKLNSVPSYLFGKKTFFTFSIENPDTILPDPNSLSSFDNVYMYAYSFPILNQQIMEINKKKIGRN